MNFACPNLKENDMKYHNGNITIDSHEIALLSLISGNEPIETNDILTFLYSLELVKNGAQELLLSCAEGADPEFIQNEKIFRASVDFTVMVCDKFNVRALQLAREAGKEVDYF